MRRYTERDENGKARFTRLVMKNAVSQEITEKFAALEDAEEKGLLWQFPCKIGDVLYKPVTGMYRGNRKITEPCVEAVVVTKIQITSNEVVFSTKLNDANHWRGDDFGLEEIGEAIFLTQEEAEEKAEEIAKELAERKE